ncbi:MAG: hypothetical protein ABI665_07400 [Vicinamibacterales bacterium]
MKRAFIACCLVSLLAPVAAELEIGRWHPERYQGYESRFELGIASFAIAACGILGLSVLGLLKLIQKQP